MSKSVWIHIIFGNACSTLGLWVEKIGGSEIFLILIPYLGPLVHSVKTQLTACIHFGDVPVPEVLDLVANVVECVDHLVQTLENRYSSLPMIFLAI